MCESEYFMRPEQEFSSYTLGSSDNICHPQGYYNIGQYQTVNSSPQVPTNSYNLPQDDVFSRFTHYNRENQSKSRERRKGAKIIGKPTKGNAARERNRVQTLRSAFLDLQRCLPAVPLDTKLSKLDVLVLATTYIGHLTWALQGEGGPESSCKVKESGGVDKIERKPAPAKEFLHPVKVGLILFQ